MCVRVCLACEARRASLLATPPANLTPHIHLSLTLCSPLPTATLPTHLSTIIQELPRLPFVFVSTPYSLSSAAENREIIGMWSFERSLRGKLREELRPLLACGAATAVPNAEESTYEKDDVDVVSRHILGRSAYGYGCESAKERMDACERLFALYPPTY